MRTLHLSFDEFLLSDKRKEDPFHVDGPATHRMLLMGCLELSLGSDGLRETYVTSNIQDSLEEILIQAVINERLFPQLRYAC